MILIRTEGQKKLAHRVLIDYNRRGWADENEEKIKKDYEEILRVGVEPNPTPDSSDEVIASFCEEKNCDLLTGDKRAYTKLLTNKRVKAVQISRYAFDTKANQQVYLVKIL